MLSSLEWWQPSKWQIDIAIQAMGEKYPLLIAEVKRVGAGQKDTHKAIQEVLANWAARPEDFEKNVADPNQLVESLFKYFTEPAR